MGRTVLVADADEGVRSLVRWTLAGDSYRVLEAVDSESALLQIARHRPDIALLEDTLHGASGLAICLSLKAQPETRGTDVVLLHAREQQVDRDRGHSLGVAAFLAKPFTPYALLRKIESLAEVG